MHVSWLTRAANTLRAWRSCAASPRPLATQGFFVLGMHRSGTSCLTGLLESAGLWLGEVSRANRNNPKGNLESKSVIDVNNGILRQFQGEWHCPPQDIQWEKIDRRALASALAPYRRRPRWAIKDPRLLLTLEAWLPLVPVRQFIGSFRHPFSVAASLHKRNGMSLDAALELWTLYNQRLVRWHKEYSFPLVNFDVAGQAYLDQFAALCQSLGLRFDPIVSRQFYDVGLNSQAERPLGRLEGQAARLYAYLVEHQFATGSEVNFVTHVVGYDGRHSPSRN